MLKLAEHILQSKTADSTQHSSSTIMKRPWSRCSRRNKPACRYCASMPRRGRRMWRTSWTHSAVALPGKSRILFAEEGAKRVEGQGVMLLAIAGNKGKAAVAKPAERTRPRQKKTG